MIWRSLSGVEYVLPDGAPHAATTAHIADRTIYFIGFHLCVLAIPYCHCPQMGPMLCQ